MYGFSKEQWDIGKNIYSLLGDKTVTPNSNIVIKPIFGREGVNYARDNNCIFTLRVKDMKYHLGNPYTSHKDLAARDNLIKVASIKDAVIAFICFVLFSEHERAAKIRSWIKDGTLKGKTLVYYQELNEPSHATALSWLINSINYSPDAINHSPTTHCTLVSENLGYIVPLRDLADSSVIKEYNQLNKEFDFTFEYSDDGSVYRKGLQQQRRLNNLYSDLTVIQKDIVNLYSNYILDRKSLNQCFVKPVLFLQDSKEQANMLFLNKGD